MTTTSWYTLRSGLRLLARPVDVLRSVRLADLRPDFMAALTVTMVLLPQTMAYALLAGLPPEVGLYSAIIASIVGALWGSSNQLQTGPSNTVALLSLAALTPLAVPGTPPYLVGASLLAFMGGVLRLAMGLARLGLLVRFVSDAVIVGFTAGAGVLIVFSQLAELLRLDLPRSSGPIETVRLVSPRLHEMHLPSLALGLAAIAIIVLLKRLNRRLPGPLIAIVIGALAAVLLALDVRVVGSLPSGFPPFSLPPVTDLELVGALSTAALSVTAIGLVEAISNARTIASHTGQRLDSNQEFVGQGLANIAAGLFSGCPVTGSFGRSMLNLQSGARTPMANVFTGLLVAVIMLGLGPLASYIPMASLAGVLLVTAWNLIDRKEMARIWRGGGADRLTMAVTLLATLTLPLQFAVLAGILMSLGAYLLRTSAPRVRTVLPSDGFRHFEPQPDVPPCPQLSITEILGDLYFGAVQHVDEAVYQNLANNPSQRFLLLRMHSVNNCDISGIHALESIVRNYREAGGDVYMSRVRLPVLQEMTASGFLNYLGRDHLLDEDAAIGYIFHHVLDPAICIYECPVRAFRECQNLPKQLPGINAGNGIHTERPTVPAPAIEPLALWQALRSETPPVIIDVREPREFRQGRVPGSRSIPLPALLADPSLAPDERPVVFVCRGGRRSARAAAALLAAGHKNVAALRGGMLAWEAANLLEAMG
jgi:sulfate permease, SulP family